jgi:hypothetical protein
MQNYSIGKEIGRFMERTEFGFARTECSCRVCVRNCEFMPGFLIPADLTSMIPEAAEPLAWALENLLASPGALVILNGKKLRIPTLVPAVKADGSCRNLSEGRCAIHEIAPFGCAFFDCGPERGQLSHRGLHEVFLAWALADSLYRKVWEYLDSHGKRQLDPALLRLRMSQLS